VLAQRHEHRKAPVAVLPPRHPRYELRIVPLAAAVRLKGPLLSEARRLSCKAQLPLLPQTPYGALLTSAGRHDRRRHKRAHTRDNSNDLQRRGGRDQGRWRYNGRYQIKRQKCSFCPRHSPPLYPPLQWTTQGPSPSIQGLFNLNNGRGLKNSATNAVTDHTDVHFYLPLRRKDLSHTVASNMPQRLPINILLTAHTTAPTNTLYHIRRSQVDIHTYPPSIIGHQYPL
jgi:hypothetical protein